MFERSGFKGSTVGSISCNYGRNKTKNKNLFDHDSGPLCDVDTVVPRIYKTS